MNPRSRLFGARSLAVAACSVLTMFAVSSPATAATFEHNFDCSGDSPLGAQMFSLQQSTDITAPGTVPAGSAFDVVIDPAPEAAPEEVNGYTVNRVENLALKIPVPANSTLAGTELTGGSNLGSTPPEISVSGGVATVRITGPIGGGETYELPTVTARLAAGDSGTIETKLHGTGYDDPGLIPDAAVSSVLGEIDVPSNCYPTPNPVLTTTTIE
ncbi:dehydratase [Saccharopolyspora lacisalsi]|uniref:Dehydratase n=1 Tax=Halosaccharopolyspora lacisalsi TaxID=1000566 RepID=A0A839E0D0_9PSEU|nr:cyclase [Halosaccharopolyspora lacisalsi]MBA8825976.1 dehydratase [Halosaccharopolyspora lacisalsi]